MRRALRGRRIVKVEVKQPKCLNVSRRVFASLLCGRTIDRIASRGKWIFTHLDPGVTFLLSLGMGGDILLHKPGAARSEHTSSRSTSPTGPALRSASGGSATPTRCPPRSCPGTR
jgi:formamidopyrimidine-DNA glycosylase